MAKALCVVLILISCSIGGCISTAASEKSHYYHLVAPDLRSRTIEPGHTEILLVGPVTLADYLNRASVALVQGESEYQFSDLDMWAGKLDNEIQLALIKQLSELQPKRVVIGYPWLADNKPEFQLRITILRFDAEPGGQAKLQAAWLLFDSNNQFLRGAHFSAASNTGVDYAQSVVAMSKLLAGMAAQIVQAMPAPKPNEMAQE